MHSNYETDPVIIDQGLLVDALDIQRSLHGIHLGGGLVKRVLIGIPNEPDINPETPVIIGASTIDTNVNPEYVDGLPRVTSIKGRIYDARVMEFNRRNN